MFRSYYARIFPTSGWFEQMRYLKETANLVQQELYAFSNSLMEETFDSFQNHMRLNDAHYVFRDGAKRCVCFVRLSVCGACVTRQKI